MEHQFRFIGLFAFVAALSLAGAPAMAGGRERICIDSGWRFIKGDPTNCPVTLRYDQREDAGRATNTPTLSLTNGPVVVLKRWILPSGNEFIEDPKRRFKRPKGNPGDGVSYVRPDFDDGSWRPVNLPHDWAIAGPFSHDGGGGMGRLPTAGVGWYRKKLEIPAADSGRRIFLDVDGAMAYATVWLNGRLVGGWPYGYASWRLDLTPYVKFGGENTLAIRLDNLPDSSRWYPGAGIYRNVWLIKTQRIHIGHWGTYLTTPEVSPERATVNLKATVVNDSEASASVSITTKIFRLDTNGRKIGRMIAAIAPANLQIAPGGDALAEGSVVILKPKLWGPPPTRKPNRYLAVTTVSCDGKTTDDYETSFGIRSLKFDPNRGVFLNGERIELKGVCDHHDLGALGAAFNTRAAQRQLEMLREMGCNALRTSHNPPAPELLDLADQMGFLVMDESFDVWYRQKTPFDFHLIFPEWREQDLRAQLRRDRNHPSVILWSIGNEVGEQYAGKDGAAVARELVNIVHEEDPMRPVTTAMNWARPGDPLPAAVDVIGLNYQGAGIRGAPGKYPAFHKGFPDKMIFGSETAAALSSRGEYFFPVPTNNSATVGPDSGEDRAGRYVSGYELYAVPFGSSPDKVFKSQETNPYVGGQFVWSGWDYLGEPTPYDASRSSYYGIIDLAGFKKDRFYLYQSYWRPDFPMAHILPHWTWPDRVGLVTPVHVFTSGDEAELFLNGRSLGRKKKARYDYRLRWDDVVYQPGTLKVVAYKNGKRWATDVVKTAGAAAKLILKPDRARISADGRDLSFVTITVTDRHGVTVPQADNRIRFEIEGPGEIVAADNGDPADFESFQSHDRKAFNGLCLVVVRSQAGQPGTIKLHVASAALKGETFILKSVSPKGGGT